MAVKIRLARKGAKKRPFYSVVAANSSSPRDGRVIEYLGYYDPLLKRGSAGRVKISQDRLDYWISRGAQPTDVVSRLCKEVVSPPEVSAEA